MPNNYVVLDTNVLPRPATIGGPFWQAILRLCKMTAYVVVVPEIVVHESVNLLRDSVAEAGEKLASANRALAKQIETHPIYVPSADASAAEWEANLRASFQILELHGDDAVEALEREALRKPPARAGRGARDSAIWLTALRLSLAGNVVRLVSKNKLDFGDGNGGLHSELIAEAEPSGADLVYFEDMDQFLASIAQEVKFSGLTMDFAPELLLEALLGSLPDDVEFSADELGDEAAAFEDFEVLRSYLVDQTGLALVRGKVILAEDSGNVVYRGIATAWITLDGSSHQVESVQIVGLEVNQLQPGSSL